MVRIPRMGVDRLVLLQPLAHRRPFEPDVAAQQLNRRGRVPPGRRRRDGTARPHIEDLGRTALPRGQRPPRGGQFGQHVPQREVVRGVVRDLPYQERMTCVRDDMTGQVGADALATRFDSHVAVSLLLVSFRDA